MPVNAVLDGLPLWFKAIVLGLVEGATEFIPVSSTGHLIVVSAWLGWSDARADSFAVFIQLGAILAIVWLYRERLLDVARTSLTEPASRRFTVSLIIAFLPAAIAGLLTYGLIKTYLFRPTVVAGALVIGGILILLIERLKPALRVDDAMKVTPRIALGIGLAQVLSLVPGVSRSGATIMGAYCLGLSRRAATEFSFFLAIPVMLAATLFDLYQSRGLLRAGDVPVFAIGFVVSFVSALVVVRAFLGYVSRGSFTVFAWYRIIFGSFLFVLYWNARA